MAETDNVDQSRIDSYLKTLEKRLLIRKIAWFVCLVLCVLSIGILFNAVTMGEEILLIDVGRIVLYGLPLLLMTRDKRKLINKDAKHPRRSEVASAALNFIGN